MRRAVRQDFLNDKTVLMIAKATLFAKKQIGKRWIFYTREGKQCVRSYARPFIPNTKKQLLWKKKFAQLVRQWHQLPPQRQEYYNQLAKYLNLKMSGFNLFLSQRLKAIGE